MMKTMHCKPLFTIAIMMAIGVSNYELHSSEPSSADFIDLFDGKSLEGWDGDPRFWRVEDGAIVGQTTSKVNPEKNTFLISRHGEFDNFELRLSFQVEGFNSGVQYRSVDRGQWSCTGYQCDFEARWHKSQEADAAEPTDTYTGMFLDEGGRMFMGARGEAVIVRTNPQNNKKPLIEKIGSVGDSTELESTIRRDTWNELVVIASGNQFVHIINGHVMAVGIDEDQVNRRDRGLFAFQLHKGQPMKILLKDIRVRRLTDSPPSLSAASRNVTNSELTRSHAEKKRMNTNSTPSFITATRKRVSNCFAINAPIAWYVTESMPRVATWAKISRQLAENSLDHI